jgi:hypothetical protein
MNTINSILITVISTISLIIGIISNSITNWLDNIVTSIFVREKICPRCGIKNEHTSKTCVLCLQCKMEVDAEDSNDDDGDCDDDCQHPHSPMYR